MALYSKILLALDFFDETEILCRHASILAERFDAEIHYIHVVEPVVLGMQDELSTIEPLGLEQELMRNSTARLQALAEQHGVGKDKLHIEVGSPKQEILRIADDFDIDLIVTGSHGRHGIGLLLGSTANAILHGASCDVLAVRLNQ
jgi:universal stress protein A